MDESYFVKRILPVAEFPDFDGGRGGYCAKPYEDGTRPLGK